MSRVRLSALMLLTAAALSLSLFAAEPSARAGGGPRLGSLELVAQLPAELPQRVSSLAYDGKKVWVMVYLGLGRHALLDPSTLEWELSRDERRHKAIREVVGASLGPSGLCFAGDKLWAGSPVGASFGYIETSEWKVGRVFKGRQRESPARNSQVYAGLACDGRYVWIAWHWFRYDVPTTQTQLLLKIEPESGQVLAEYPLPAGHPTDSTHGLTWDGSRLWHAKDNRLSAIEPSTGLVTEQHVLPGVRRASGLAWDGESLWIAEFDGKIWRLRF